MNQIGDRSKEFYFELHSFKTNGLNIVGFLCESYAAQISHLSGETTHNIVISPSFWEKMTSLISILIDPY